MADLRTVPLSEIRENPVALRAVNKESEGYIGLRDSIKDVGILNAINVRERTEDVDGTTVAYYELVDGLHRYSCAVDVGLGELPVQVLSLDNVEVLEAQIMANVHKIETRPVEYTKQLQRILSANPTMTLSDLAGKLSKSPAWVNQRLGLLKLSEDIQELVDDEKIIVTNAVALAKLPIEEQINFVDQAMTQSPDEFVPTVQARAKEIRAAKLEGRRANPPSFAPVARLRKLGDLKTEHTNPTAGPDLCNQIGVSTAAEGFALAIAWGLHLDPVSVAIQQNAAEEKAALLKEAKDKRDQARAKKRAEAAAAKAAELAEGLEN